MRKRSQPQSTLAMPSDRKQPSVSWRFRITVRMPAPRPIPWATLNVPFVGIFSISLPSCHWQLLAEVIWELKQSGCERGAFTNNTINNCGHVKNFPSTLLKWRKCRAKSDSIIAASSNIFPKDQKAEQYPSKMQDKSRSKNHRRLTKHLKLEIIWSFKSSEIMASIEEQ